MRCADSKADCQHSANVAHLRLPASAHDWMDASKEIFYEAGEKKASFGTHGFFVLKNVSALLIIHESSSLYAAPTLLFRYPNQSARFHKEI